jgi:predicted small lipoprotein YifL
MRQLIYRRIMMKTFPQLLVGILLIAALAGCGPVTPLPPIEPQAPSATGAPLATSELGMVFPPLIGNWHVSLTRSGGLMGSTTILNIASGGKMILTDASGKSTDKGSLSAGELATLADLLAATKYKQANQPNTCADCINLLVVVSNEDRKLEAQSSEPDLPASGLQPLVEFLAKYMR